MAPFSLFQTLRAVVQHNPRSINTINSLPHKKLTLKRNHKNTKHTKNYWQMKYEEKRRLVLDYINQLRIDQNETTTQYHKITLAINATLFAISSAGVGYSVNNALGSDVATPFVITILFSLLTMMFSKNALGQKRRKEAETLDAIHKSYLADHQHLERLSPNELKTNLSTQSKNALLDNPTSYNIFIFIGNIASQLSLIIGIIYLVYFA